MKNRILITYRKLLAHYGPQHWWPGDNPFEVMIGAILTQSASWKNVEKAIGNLKKAGVLSSLALRQIPLDELAGLIHSCGYFNAKSLKLKALVYWLGETCSDDLETLFTRNVKTLRQQLLALYGIGPETADSILLYAGNKPVFVIDAYTRRIISRLGPAPDKDHYESYQELFMRNLPQDTELFNEFHALLVRLGKESCKKQPVCMGCCIFALCK